MSFGGFTRSDLGCSRSSARARTSGWPSKSSFRVTRGRRSPYSPCGRSMNAARLALFIVMIVPLSARMAAAPPLRSGQLRLVIVDEKGEPVSGAVVALEALWLDLNTRGAGANNGQLKTMTRPDGPKIGVSNQHGVL